MIEILLKENGSINAEGIDEYIKTHGIEARYDNPSSVYHQQTLLESAISSNEINPETKLKLVSYLISKGARYKDLLGAVLMTQNLDLADLLLKEGANIDVMYDGKNLFEIALDLKNEKILLWVLNNARSFFIELTSNKFARCYEKIAAIFPDYAKSELHLPLKEIAEAHLKYIFRTLGRININDTALILAAKMAKKPYENSIFVISDKDMPALIEQIKKFILTDTNANVIKFQIIHFHEGHAVFGEFEIDKTNKPAAIRYLHCDPARNMTKYFVVISLDFIKELSPIANIEICDSDVKIQKGLGCTIFSIDGAMMLTTPSDRTYAVNVFEHIKKHGTVEDGYPAIKNIKYIKSTSLPTRFLRGTHLIDGSEEALGFNSYKGQPNIYKTIFNTEERNTIVNKKGETAEKSISKDLQKRTTLMFNLRTDRKLTKYEEDVREFIKDKDIISPEFSTLLDQYKIKGLVQFCEKQCEKKTEPRMK